MSFQNQWATLKSRIDKLLAFEPVPQREFLDIFGTVFRLCVLSQPNRGRDLYDATKKRIEQHLTDVSKGILKIDAPLDFIKEYSRNWGEFKMVVTFLNASYNAMNDQWVKNHQQELQRKGKKDEVFTIRIMAWRAWKEALMDPVKERMRTAVFQLLAQERRGETVETETIRNAINSYIELGKIKQAQGKQLEIYKTEFEAQFLVDTQEFYEKETTAFLASNNVSDYLKLAEKRLDEELNRAKIYVDPSSHDAHAAIINKTLVSMHKERLQEEVPALLSDNRIEDLRRMFRLMDRIEGGIQPMLDGFFAYIKKVGGDAFKKLKPDYEKMQKKPSTREELATITKLKNSFPLLYVSTFLKLYAQCAEMCKTAFQNHPRFVSSLDKGAASVLNSNGIEDPNSKSQPSAYYTAKYAHQLLTDKKIAKDMLAGKLDDICTVYKYLENRDAFHLYYKRLFSTRLLDRLSTDRDNEIEMINKLKLANSAYDFISSLNKMVNDMKDAVKLSQEFTASAKPNIQINPIVCTRASWPIEASEMSRSLELPKELKTYSEKFNEFYTKKHEARSINWLHEYSKVVVTTDWLKTRYRITLNHFQATVLLAWNSAADARGLVSYVKLAEVTKAQPDYLKAATNSLVKVNLLQRKPPKGEIDDAKLKVQIRLNPAFKAPKRVLDASIAKFYRTPKVDSGPKEDPSIEEERKLKTQAAIVRIMKSKRKFGHQALISETAKQTVRWFPTNVPRIKRCIEFLLQHDPPFLERIDNRTYQYLA